MSQMLAVAIKMLSDRTCSERDLRRRLEKEFVELPDLDKRIDESIARLRERVSGKGNITHDAIILSKLKPSYGDRFYDKLCCADSKITVILLYEQALPK